MIERAERALPPSNCGRAAAGAAVATITGTGRAQTDGCEACRPRVTAQPQDRQPAPLGGRRRRRPLLPNDRRPLKSGTSLLGGFCYSLDTFEWTLAACCPAVQFSAAHILSEHWREDLLSSPTPVHSPYHEEARIYLHTRVFPYQLQFQGLS